MEPAQQPYYAKLKLSARTDYIHLFSIPPDLEINQLFTIFG